MSHRMKFGLAVVVGAVALACEGQTASGDDAPEGTGGVGGGRSDEAGGAGSSGAAGVGTVYVEEFSNLERCEVVNGTPQIVETTLGKEVQFDASLEDDS